jgi:hypothetical protein
LGKGIRPTSPGRPRVIGSLIDMIDMTAGAVLDRACVLHARAYTSSVNRFRESSLRTVRLSRFGLTHGGMRGASRDVALRAEQTAPVKNHIDSFAGL